MAYKVVKSDPHTETLEFFEKRVNAFLTDGWKLTGSLVVLPVDTGDKKTLGTQFLQPLYRD